MKNLFRVKTYVKPSNVGEKQRLPKDFSPKVLRREGMSFGWLWLMKQLIKGSRTFEIADTNSMVPALDHGHVLYCEPAEWDKLQKGDVCVYQDNRGLIVHRILIMDRRGGKAIFRGDNNLFSDPPVTKSQVKWRVIAIGYAR